MSAVDNILATLGALAGIALMGLGGAVWMAGAMTDATGDDDGKFTLFGCLGSFAGFLLLIYHIGVVASGNWGWVT